MKYPLLFSLVSLSLNSFSQHANDSTRIIQLLKEDYATMGNMNIQAHLNNLTKEYLLIEHGQIWDAKTEVDSIYKKYAKDTFTRRDFFTIKTVKVSGDMAYGVWYLRSEFDENGKTRELAWNESGVFRKEQGQWKIALIHSSRLPEK
jgi:ketosteroid isomerase-like protein